MPYVSSSSRLLCVYNTLASTQINYLQFYNLLNNNGVKVITVSNIRVIKGRIYLLFTLVIAPPPKKMYLLKIFKSDQFFDFFFLKKQTTNVTSWRILFFHLLH